MRNEHEKEAWREAQYQSADTNGKLLIRLRDVDHMMRGLYEGRGSQQRVLIVLHELGGSVTQRVLTERLQIRSGSASEVIGKLESAGYVVRTVSEADRRNVEVALTEKGREAAEEVKRQREQRQEEMFLCLTDAEKDELLVLLEKLSTDWETRFSPSGAHFEHRHHGRDGHHGPHGHGEFRRRTE